MEKLYTQKAQILDALAEGSCTTPEVTAITGLPRKHTCAILRYLWQSGVVTREPFKRSKLVPTFLWTLKA